MRRAVDPETRRLANEAIGRALDRKRGMPFLERMEEAARRGEKTTTARTKRYGRPGDLVATRNGLLLRFTEVEKVRLDVVRDHYWRDEGCSSSEDFEQVWNGIHPLRGFVPDQMVWLHRFVVERTDLNETSADEPSVDNAVRAAEDASDRPHHLDGGVGEPVSDDDASDADRLRALFRSSSTPRGTPSRGSATTSRSTRRRRRSSRR